MLFCIPASLLGCQTLLPIMAAWYWYRCWFHPSWEQQFPLPGAERGSTKPTQKRPSPLHPTTGGGWGIIGMGKCGMKNQTLPRLTEAGAGGMIAMGTDAPPRMLLSPSKPHPDQPPQHVQQQASVPPGAPALRVTPQPALPASVSPRHPSLLPATERFPSPLDDGVGGGRHELHH